MSRTPRMSRRSALGAMSVGALGAITAVPVIADVTGIGRITVPGVDRAAPRIDVGSRQPRRIILENLAEGSSDWSVGTGGTTPADDIHQQIKVYASDLSVNVGGAIDLHVSVSPAQPFTIEIYRLGDYQGYGARRVGASPTLAGSPRPVPIADPVTGMTRCRWPVSWTLDVPVTWTSGSYVAVCTSQSGWRGMTTFVVRDDRRSAALLVIVPVTTYQAYNQFPRDGVRGKSLYYGYPPGATVPPSVDAIPDGAYEYRATKVSFDRPYAATGLPHKFELGHDVIRWIENAGYDVTYATDIDLHAGRVEPDRYDAIVFSGHDEYWSRPMRDTVTNGVTRGTSLAFMTANNVYWHIRFEPTDGRADRVMVCYRTDDPQEDASGPTTRWRDMPPEGAHAETGLLGVAYNGVVQATAPLVVAGADHWFWAGCEATDGDHIPLMVDGEADGLHAGAPIPTGARQTILSASPYLYNGQPRTQNTSVYETANGALVFVAGTFNWPAGLCRPGYRDIRIARATGNLFDRIVRGS